LEILVIGNLGNSNLGGRFFKHKYLTNPTATPEDLIIATAENLAQKLSRPLSHNSYMSQPSRPSRIYWRYSQTQPKITMTTPLGMVYAWVGQKITPLTL
jgi:hypothetical protein